MSGTSLPRHGEPAFVDYPSTSTSKTPICGAVIDLSDPAGSYEFGPRARGGQFIPPHHPQQQAGPLSFAPRRRRRGRRLRITRGGLYLDGAEVALGDTADARAAAICFVEYVLRKGGDWITGPEIDRAEEKKGVRGLDGTRWSRVRNRLPKSVRNLIESGGPKGYRLTPDALA